MNDCQCQNNCHRSQFTNSTLFCSEYYTVFYNIVQIFVNVSQMSMPVTLMDRHVVNVRLSDTDGIL